LAGFAPAVQWMDALQQAGQAEFFEALAQRVHAFGLDWWMTPKSLEPRAGRSENIYWHTSAVMLALRATAAGVELGMNKTHDMQDSQVAFVWQALTPEAVEQALAWLASVAGHEYCQRPAHRPAYWPDDYLALQRTLCTKLTDGALKNDYLAVSAELAPRFFPAQVLGTADTPAPESFEVQRADGKLVSTYVRGTRLRDRTLFTGQSLQPGDYALLTEVAPLHYALRFLRQADRGVAPAAASSLAPEMISAESHEMTMPLNQILYGPPGTGKTYATVTKTLEILEPQWLADLARGPLAGAEKRQQMKQRFDALHAQGRVTFTTFHQSFSYEDFVEGIRAVSDEKSQQLSYPVVDGVFKSMCQAASVTTIQPSAEPVELGQRQVWKMSLGNTQGDDAGVYEECIQGGYVLLGYGEDIDFRGCQSKQDVRERYEKHGVTLEEGNDYRVTSVATFILKLKVGDLVVVSDGNYKLRAIGEITSDYEYAGPHAEYGGYAQRRQVRWLREYSPSLPYSELLERAFSQMTLYALKAPNLVRDKLQHLLGEASGMDAQFPFYVGQTIGTGYKVLRISKDLVELSKPRDAEKVLHLPRSPIEALIAYVREGRLSVDDIRQKRVFEIVPDAPLEKFLVNGYENVLAAMVQLAVQTTATPVKTHSNDARVLVIDEINRGNVSRIFGELITLLEPSKRAGASEALSVTLPYSKQSFSVPGNVYIIGTMNTTDRSLAGLDVALRRRFEFEELMPAPKVLNNATVTEGAVSVNIAQLLQVMNERIEVLLDREHQLGHAYFMELCEDASLARLVQIFKSRVIPLLQEYFFDDWERIAWVLNDHRKPEAQRFVIRHGRSLEALFGSNDGVQAVDKRWRINEEAFKTLGSFKAVIEVDRPSPAIQSEQLEAAPAGSSN
jgi:5-methylcytosine-specific restriction protein B